MAAHNIFVYGSLRRGGWNHHILAGAAFGGAAQTVEAYSLRVDGLPMVHDAPPVSRIHGELYAVDDEGLMRLDALEGHPHLYERRQVDVHRQGDEPGRAWLYFCRQDDPGGELLEHGDYMKWLADTGGHRVHPQEEGAGPSEASPYFAYGSNMNHLQMENRCPGARFLGPGRLDGYRFLINTRGVATLCEEAGACVYGALWELPPGAIQILDRFEGVDAGRYHRKRLHVVHEDLGPTPAMIYLDPRVEPGLPRPGYLETVLRGAGDCGLPHWYQDALTQWGNGAPS